VGCQARTWALPFQVILKNFLFGFFFGEMILAWFEISGFCFIVFGFLVARLWNLWKDGFSWFRYLQKYYWETYFNGGFTLVEFLLDGMNWETRHKEMKLNGLLIWNQPSSIISLSAKASAYNNILRRKQCRRKWQILDGANQKELFKKRNHFKFEKYSSFAVIRLSHFYYSCVNLCNFSHSN